MGIFFKSAEEKYDLFLKELHDISTKIVAHQKKMVECMATKDMKKNVEGVRELKAAKELKEKGHEIASELVAICKKLKKPLPALVQTFHEIERKEKETELRAQHKGALPTH
jgi:hypothetical protein